ncbi:MAG TPA: response regulator [Chloroflexota bacterium]
MPRILVVEDDVAIATMIASELRHELYDVFVAETGVEALDAIESVRPDAIVLDLTMPVVSGWDFLDQYRSRNPGGLIPIVAVSAAGTAASGSMEAFGVRYVVTKPFEIEELIQCVGNVTGQVTP